MNPYLILFAIVFVLAGCAPESEPASTSTGAESVADAPPALSVDTRQAVEAAIFSLDQMRSGLAGTLEGRTEPVDAGTFAQVCKPVGMEAMRLGNENNWQVRQVAVKYRNPANKADPEAAEISMQFATDKTLDSLWTYTELAGKPGWRYFRSIEVEPACLACHGAKDSRPAFVKEKYTDDHAFDFSVGDLRGLYSVFVPDDSTAFK